MSKSKIARSKPRNPFAVFARFRRAGKHAPEPGGIRQAERRYYIRDLAGFDLMPVGDEADDKPPSE
jgi:hypothetical protein